MDRRIAAIENKIAMLEKLLNEHDKMLMELYDESDIQGGSEDEEEDDVDIPEDVGYHSN
jgi:hypothetical protein